MIENAGRVLNRISLAVLRHPISGDHHRVLAKREAHFFEGRISRSECDILLAPNAGIEIAYLSTKVPIVYYTDLTWASIVDYYPAYTSLLKYSRDEADRVEAFAIGKARALILPSPWAAEKAISHYKADPRNVYCIPCGANFERADIPSHEAAVQHLIDKEVVLLWVGVDWARKGGPIAYNCMLELLRKGVEARLIVCGCVPPESYRHPNVEVIPFLNKRDPVQRQMLSELFLKAHFFLFPTKSEAYGIVLCEASAHGLPSLVRNTGGIGGAVTDGENGYLMPHDAEGEQYAEKILAILDDRSGYDRLVLTSRIKFERVLNWDAWAQEIKPIFESIVKDSSRAQSKRAVAAI